MSRNASIGILSREGKEGVQENVGSGHGPMESVVPGAEEETQLQDWFQFKALILYSSFHINRKCSMA